MEREKLNPKKNKSNKNNKLFVKHFKDREKKKIFFNLKPDISNFYGIKRKDLNGKKMTNFLKRKNLT